MEHRVSTQVLREGTLQNIFSTPQDSREAGVMKMPSQIAWNIATTAFYKTGGRPWKVDGIRKGVCYVGLVYKKDQRSTDNKMACCGAQMFLDSGDGVVFKGAVGQWLNVETGDFHLSAQAGYELIDVAVKSYKDSRTGKRLMNCSSTEKQPSTTSNGRAFAKLHLRKRISSASRFATIPA